MTAFHTGLSRAELGRVGAKGTWFSECGEYGGNRDTQGGHVSGSCFNKERGLIFIAVVEWGASPMVGRER